LEAKEFSGSGELRDKVRVFSATGQLRERLNEIGTYFLHKEGGEGKKEKKYWMTAGEEVIMNNEAYVFGIPNKTVYILKKEEDVWREELEQIAREIATAAGQEPPTEAGAFTVTCRYSEGSGVGPHKDDDYRSPVNTIVSMTLIGGATFELQYKGKWYPVELEAGDIVVFDRFIRHRANGARGIRVNVTTRYALKGADNVFIRPSWYHPQGIPKGRG
jgi:hypothetical protein